ncbi:hypothetical protein OHU45_33265 [Streptomyces tubercidicus]|uniref:hypothetical protein n=1 Tax=Streptomyces tubercidicus TaxID=47759 RepID=UPI002E0F97B7|nr:hypothetical protein OG761_33245 [Streptomyces tubercidicus]WSX19069.1 hypothetical protein OG690_04100 [Streptomyces tubercidicus]
MTSLAHRIRRIAAIAVSLAAGSTLAPAGTATAYPGRPSAPAAPDATPAPVAGGLYQSAYSERNHVLTYRSALRPFLRTTPGYLATAAGTTLRPTAGPQSGEPQRTRRAVR